MRPIVLPLTALAVALGLAACNQQPSAGNSADMALTNADNGAGDMMTNGEEEVADTDAGTTAPAIAIPTVAADAPAEQSVPVAEAAQAAATIVSDPNVGRVAWGDGWAWKRDGQVIRTASRDGRRVSYFHPGARQPYYVQDGDRSFGYDDSGKLAHVYDHGGHPKAPDANTRHDADQLDREARRDHDHARNAPPAPSRNDHNGSHRSNPPAHQGDDGHQGPSRGHPTPTPTPTPTPSPTPDRHHGGNNDHNGGRPDGHHDNGH